jgi:hypothetical protein
MSTRIFGRFGLLFFLAAVFSGCSSSGESLECRVSPGSCMHEGSYEQGEDVYAEKKAKDLNREAARKARRGSSWW